MNKFILGFAVPTLLLIIGLSSCSKDDDPNTNQGDTTAPILLVDDFQPSYNLAYQSGTTIVEAQKVQINGVASDETQMDYVRIRIFEHQTGEYIFEKLIESDDMEITFSEEWHASQMGNYSVSISAYDKAGNYKGKSAQFIYLN